MINKTLDQRMDTHYVSYDKTNFLINSIRMGLTPPGRGGVLNVSMIKKEKTEKAIIPKLPRKTSC